MILALILLGAAASAPAMAHGGGRVHFGFFIGGPVWSPWYYPPPYYYYPPPVVVAPSSPPAYIERGGPDSAEPSQSYWYYCPDARAYYPYVKQCPGGWRKEMPQPPSGQ